MTHVIVIVLCPNWRFSHVAVGVLYVTVSVSCVTVSVSCVAVSVSYVTVCVTFHCNCVTCVIVIVIVLCPN